MVSQVSGQGDYLTSVTTSERLKGEGEKINQRLQSVKCFGGDTSEV